ncbi:hypothetical protein CEXT_568951 [Caerostris extrusa]|uniref:Uncharacterized protein n=1 Tax=Caerostris extrusa TaxID=172846 RepID=A0AAV4RS86_CAEEX|nr:hypothetical protein CEXT_568951 [Caerostris extrusa]
MCPHTILASRFSTPCQKQILTLLRVGSEKGLMPVEEGEKFVVENLFRFPPGCGMASFGFVIAPFKTKLFVWAFVTFTTLRRERLSDTCPHTILAFRFSTTCQKQILTLLPVGFMSVEEGDKFVAENFFLQVVEWLVLCL